MEVSRVVKSPTLDVVAPTSVLAPLVLKSNFKIVARDRVRLGPGIEGEDVAVIQRQYGQQQPIADVVPRESRIVKVLAAM